jgi:L-alanine-DL-glutamate epimerase-like enolase superfamily enzyme
VHCSCCAIVGRAADQGQVSRFLQPDITWLGGLTEARRIVAMAAAYDILVIPHGESVCLT